MKNATLQFKNMQKKHYHDMNSKEDIDKRRETKNHIKKVHTISEFLDIRNGDQVLEIGVGTGIHAKELLELNKNKKFHFTGVDLSPDLLAVTSKKLVDFPNVYLKEMDAENLSFANATFDKVFIASTLHHLFTPEKGFDEMIRVLKPGGKVAIVEPNYIHPKNLLFCHSKEAERNMVYMQKKYFKKWFAKHQVHYTIQNFIYAPAKPLIAQPFFMLVEKIAPSIPFIRNFSIMLLITGIKEG